MKFSCEQCHAQYMIADEKVGERGVKVKCKKCSNIIVVRPQAQGSEPPVPDVATRPEEGEAGAGSSGLGATSDTLAEGGGLGLAAAGGLAAQDGEAPSIGAASPSSQNDFGDFNLGALAQPAVAARSPAGEKEWYVAIEDAQIGPIDVSEIEQRWDERELSAESLAWKTGMLDWVPLAEIPELAYLITERPHPKPQGYGAAASAELGGSFADGDGASPGAVVREQTSWKPSAASALSSLVQDELVAAAAPKSEPTAPPAGVPDLGMPGFGAPDLFSAGGAATQEAAVRPDPFSGPAPAWSVPVVPRRSGGLKWVIPVFGLGLLGLAVVGLLGFLVLDRLGYLPARAAAPGAPVAAAQAEPANKPKPEDATAAAQAQPADTKPEPRAAVTPKRAETKEPRAEAPREKRPTPVAPPREKPRERAKASEDPLAGIEGESAPPAKASLTKEDVVNGVKKNLSIVAPCLKEARAKGEIEPGQYTFTLEWVIQPDGSVSKAALKGPPNVLSSSLPGCFAVSMKRWRFPASQKAMPIFNFPFGPVNIR